MVGHPLREADGQLGGGSYVASRADVRKPSLLRSGGLVIPEKPGYVHEGRDVVACQEMTSELVELDALVAAAWSPGSHRPLPAGVVVRQGDEAVDERVGWTRAESTRPARCGEKVGAGLDVEEQLQ